MDVRGLDFDKRSCFGYFLRWCGSSLCLLLKIFWMDVYLCPSINKWMLNYRLIFWKMTKRLSKERNFLDEVGSWLSPFRAYPERKQYRWSCAWNRESTCLWSGKKTLMAKLFHWNSDNRKICPKAMKERPTVHWKVARWAASLLDLYSWEQLYGIVIEEKAKSLGQVLLSYFPVAFALRRGDIGFLFIKQVIRNRYSIYSCCVWSQVFVKQLQGESDMLIVFFVLCPLGIETRSDCTCVLRLFFVLFCSDTSLLFSYCKKKDRKWKLPMLGSLLLFCFWLNPQGRTRTALLEVKRRIFGWF